MWSGNKWGATEKKTMENDTLIVVGIWIIILFVIYTAILVIRMLRHDALNITQEDWIEFFRR